MSPRAAIVLLPILGCDPAARPAGSTTPSMASTTPVTASPVIVVRNDTATPVTLNEALGPSTFVQIADEAGRLAPVSLFAPPHPCERDCREPTATTCSTLSGEGHLDPGASLTIPWDGTLRRIRPRDGWRCFDREPAPPGAYLLRACSEDDRCGLVRLTLPRTEPVVIALRDPESGPAPCDAAIARRAVGLALGEARLAGAPDASLAGCEGLAPVCGGADLDDEPGTCRARVEAAERRLDVTLRPASRDGAPLRVTVSTDADAVGTGRAFADRSRWAVSADGSLLVRGEPGHAIHEHGGDAARIQWATFIAYNRGTTPRPIALRAARWTSSPGRTIPLDGAALMLEGTPAGRAIVLAPGARAKIFLSFPPQQAYQASGDRFDVEADLDVEGATLRPRAEIHVTRIEVRRP